MAGNFDRKLRLPHINFRVLLHAANMRLGTKALLPFRRKACLRFFLPEKSDGALGYQRWALYL